MGRKELIMFNIFSRLFFNNCSNKTTRALKTINSGKNFTHLQKACIAKLYLENDVGKKIVVSPEYFSINKKAYRDLLEKIFQQGIAEKIRINPYNYNYVSLQCEIILRDV